MSECMCEEFFLNRDCPYQGELRCSDCYARLNVGRGFRVNSTFQREKLFWIHLDCWMELVRSFCFVPTLRVVCGRLGGRPLQLR